MLALHAAFADCVATLVLKIMVVDGAWVGRVFGPLRCRIEGFFDTVLGVGRGARKYGAGFVVSLAHSLSSSRRASGRPQGCQVRSLVTLSISRERTAEKAVSLLSSLRPAQRLTPLASKSLFLRPLRLVY